LRVGEMVRHALVALLQRGEIIDAEIEHHIVSINQVEMSPDLKIATVFLSPLGGGDAEALDRAFARHHKLIRGRVSPALRQLRSMPEFRFRADSSFDNYARIDRILHEPQVARDIAKRAEDE
jgi:ribosome-binding factor A